MKLVNNSARLIDINYTGKDGAERVRLLPAGDAQDVPAEVVKTAFVQALLKSKDVSQVAEQSANDEGDSKGGKGK